MRMYILLITQTYSCYLIKAFIIEVELVRFQIPCRDKFNRKFPRTENNRNTGLIKLPFYCLAYFSYRQGSFTYTGRIVYVPWARVFSGTYNELMTFITPAV